MKRTLFTAALAVAGLIGLACTARAQYSGTAGPVVPPPGAPAMVLPPGTGPSCAAETCMKPCCKPYLDKKVTIKPCFYEKCEDFCQPLCWSCSLFGKCCDSGCGPNHKCEHPRTRKDLWVKLPKREELIEKCYVDYVPKCVETKCCVGKQPCCSAPGAAPSGVPHSVVAPPAVNPPTATPKRLPMTSGN
jgi:hypothetical protein